MITLPIQNFIPFFVPTLFPSELRNIEEKGEGIEAKQDPEGLLQRRSPSVTSISFFFSFKYFSSFALGCSGSLLLHGLFSGCGARSPLSGCRARRPLILVTSPVAEHGL